MKRKPGEIIKGDVVMVKHMKLDGAFVTEWKRVAQVVAVREGALTVRYKDDPSFLHDVRRDQLTS